MPAPFLPPGRSDCFAPALFRRHGPCQGSIERDRRTTGFACSLRRASMRHAELIRRRSTDAREECWHVYYGDVLAGTIAIRSGNPHDEDPWEWHCGFYPGSHSGEHKDGTAASFDEARSDSKPRGRFFWRSEPRLTFRRGVASKIGPLENMRCGKPAKNCHRRNQVR